MTRLRLPARGVLPALVVLALAAPGAAPEQRQQRRVPSATQAPPAQQDLPPIFRVPVTTVLAPVTVTDGSGEYIMDLKPEHFVLLDNNVRQQITVELAEMPLSLVILVSNSARLEPLIPQVRKIGNLFTNLVIGETGEAAVITFDHRVEVLQEFTSDAERIEKVFKDLPIGSEQARLSDAIVRGLSMLSLRPPGRRKVILVVAEGRDWGSETDLGFVLSEAQRASVSIYSVGLSGVRSRLTAKPANPGPPQFPPGAAGGRPGFPAATTSPTARANSGDILAALSEAVRGVRGIIFDHPLEAYAEGTGAVHIGGFSNKAIEEAVSRIGRELRSQYLISYRPNNLTEPAFHSIKVSVDRRGVKVRTKPGYYYPGTGGSGPPADGAR